MPDFVLLDLETTGLDLERSEIIEIGAVAVSDMKICDEFNILVKPNARISDEITALTGITNEMLADAEDSKAAIKKLKQFIGDKPVAAHNGCGFDFYLLKRYGCSLNEAYDSMDFSFFVLPLNESHSIDNLSKQFGLGDEKHRALEDCKLQLQIIRKLISEFSHRPAKIIEHSKHLSSSLGWWWDAFLPGKPGGFNSFIDIAEPYKKYRKELGQDAFLAGTQKVDIELADKYFDPSQNGDPEYGEIRPAQKEISRILLSAMNEKKHAIVEAGTGIGKSKAYLVAGTLFAQKNSLPLVVSTHTKVLQDQLFTKEIPHIKDLLGKGLKVSVLKGKQNYVCLSKIDEVYHSIHELGIGKNFDLTRNGPRYERALSFLLLGSWTLTTRRGDWDEIPYWLKNRFSGSFEDEVKNSDESCAKGLCDGFEENKCFLAKAKLGARDADVVIVNHALLLSGIVRSRIAGEDGKVSFSYSHTMLSKESQYIVLDEAHFLEDDATSAWEATVNRKSFQFISTLVYNPKGVMNLIGSLCNTLELSKNEELNKAYENLSVQKEKLAVLSGIFTDQAIIGFVGKENGRYALEKAIDEQASKTKVWLDTTSNLSDLSTSFHLISEGLKKIAKILSDNDQPEKTVTRIIKVAEWLERFVQATGKLLADDGESVRYIRLENGELSFISSPISVANLLRDNVFDNFESVSVLSATLTVDKKFDFIKNRYGLDLLGRDRLIFRSYASSFDYASIMRLFIARGIKYDSSNTEEFFQSTMPFLKEAILASRGGSLVLCSSHEQVTMISNFLKKEIGSELRVLAQSKSHSANSLVREFKKDINSVLVGTESFWHGVDVPGKSLRTLFILKIPYKNFMMPVVQARRQHVKAAGGDEFLEYYQPLACMSLKQGLGRLIRKSTDKGVAVLLDDRIMQRPQIYNSLPEGMDPKIVDQSDICEQIKIMVEKWQDPQINTRTSKLSQTYYVKQIREKYQSAYKPWTREDDEKLKYLSAEGKSNSELAQLFGRESGAIKSRLRKLGV